MAVRNKLVTTVRWRTLNRNDLQSDEETAKFIQNANQVCWNTGAIFSFSAAAAAGGDATDNVPTLSEYVTINQFHTPTFGHLTQRYGANSKAICGACSVAAAMICSKVISEKGWWASALNPGRVSELLRALCDEAAVVPLIENVVHYISAQRIRYMQSDPQCDRGLKTSAAQQKLFLSDQAANFELSDCIRAMLGMAQEAAANNNNVPLVAAEFSNNKIGPTPYNGAIPRNIASVVPAAGLLYMRANLFPIVHTAKHMQKRRILAEEGRFGGREEGPGRVTYGPGECTFFVDVLASEVVGKRVREEEQQRQQKEKEKAGAAAAATGKPERQQKVDDDDLYGMLDAATEKKAQPQQPQSKAKQQVQQKEKEYIDVDALSDDDDKSKWPKKTAEGEARRAPSPDAAVDHKQEQRPATTGAEHPSLQKFYSPINFCRTLVNDKSSPLHPPTTGPRVYVVDVLGHFVALLCYVDSAGTPHGVVINSSESRELSAVHRPTLRFAFELYVANVCAAV